jgi:hypothetical protein
MTLFDITNASKIAADPFWGSAGLYLYPEVVNVPVIDDSGNPIGDVVNIGPLEEGEQ